MILAVMFWGCATVRLLTGAYSPIGGGEQTKELKQKNAWSAQQRHERCGSFALVKKIKREALSASDLHNCHWPSRTRYDSAALKQLETTVSPTVNRRLPTPQNTLHWKVSASSHYIDQESSSECILQTVRSFLKTGQRNVSMITGWDLSSWSRNTKQKRGTKLLYHRRMLGKK